MRKILFLCIFTFITTAFAADNFSNAKPYIVYIKPGAKLTSTFDKSIVHIERGIYANVLEVNPKLRDLFYVLDKNGRVKYQVEATDIVEINDDVNLLPEDKANIVYKEPSKFHQKNKILNLESEFTFAIDRVDVSPLANFIDTEITTIMAPRYKFNTHYMSIFPINIGANINYQSAMWKDQQGVESRLNILSIGPEFKFNIIDQDTYKFSTHLSYEFCPNYSVSSVNGSTKYSANLWMMGLNNEFDTMLGKITLGIDFRKHYLTYKSSNQEQRNLMSSELRIASFGINIGYNYYWDL